MCEEKKRYHTTIRVKDEYGRETMKHVSAKSDRELKDKVRHIKNDIEDGKNVLDEGIFSAWAEEWFKTQIDGQGNSSGYVQSVRASVNHLLRYFADTPIKDIQKKQITDMVAELAKENPNTHKPSSKKTLNNLIHACEMIFAFAAADNIAGVNTSMFKFINAPKNAPKKKVNALTEEEIRMIIDTPHRAQPIAMTMLFAGLRRGEAIALEWKQVDFARNEIHVVQSAEYEKNKTTIKKGGKTEAAERSIPMPQVLTDYLKEYRKKCPLNIEDIGKGKPDLVFTNASGGMLTPSSFRRMWESYICDLNVKYGFEGQDVSKYSPEKLPMRIEEIKAHQLRHTYATMLCLQDISHVSDKEWCGHSSIDVTVDIYTDTKKLNKRSSSEWLSKHLLSDFSVAKYDRLMA